MVRKVGQFAWDKEVDFKQFERKLVKEINELKKSEANRTNDVRLAYNLVLLTQLRNGARVGEAVEAMMKATKEYSEKVKVRVEKKKQYVERTIYIPREADKKTLRRVRWVFDDEKEKIVARIKSWARKHHNVNTHALRYAFITELARKGVSAQVIAKITMHSKLDYILYYTQRVEAEKILKEINQR